VHSSAERIAALATPDAAASTLRAAAANPSSAPTLLATFFIDMDLGPVAAANPALDRDRLERWWRNGDHFGTLAHIGLLANPNMGRDVLVDALALGPPAARRVARNPNADSDLLLRIWNLIADPDPFATLTGGDVLAHPACPESLVNAALASPDPAIRRRGAANTAHSVEQLAAIIAAERNRGAGQVLDVIAAASNQLALRELDEHPERIPAEHLHLHPIVDRLADALRDPDIAAAATAMLRAGFAGTAEELIDVAGGVLADPTAADTPA
jgi:hypothetical protein